MYFTNIYRCLLAALHFNKNAGRAQKKTKCGHLHWRATSPKYCHGEGVVKQVKGPCTYSKFM